MSWMTVLWPLMALFSSALIAGEGDILIHDPVAGTMMVESSPIKIKTPGKGLFKTPDGSFKRPIDPSCAPEKIKQIMRNENTTHFESSQNTRELFANCEKKMRKTRISKLSLVSLIKLQANLGKNPQITKTIIHLSDGTKVSALIGIKPGNKPRPLILTQCGLSCRAHSDYANSLLFMHVFEESPFNVISLGSTSNNDYSKMNNILAMGGVEEGRHMIEVADLIMSQNSFLKKKISSMHAMGFSLGGGGLFYGVLFDELNRLPNGKKRFNSALGMCPVVDLGASLHSLTYEGLLRSVTYNYIKGKAIALKEVSPYLMELSKSKITKKKLMTAFGHAMQESYTKLHKRGTKTFLPFKEMPHRSVKDVMIANNFANYSHLIKTPTFIISSKNDIVVRHKKNTQLLLDKHQNKKDSPIQILTLNKGSHCSYSFTYGWQTLSTIGREYFLRHSPEFKEVGVTKVIPVDFKTNLGTDIINLDQEWKFEKGKDQAKVQFTYYSPKLLGTEEASCRRSAVFGIPSSCYHKKIVTVDLKQLPIKAAPIDKEEANRLSRKANIHWSLVSENGLKITGTGLRATGVRTEIWPNN